MDGAARYLPKEKSYEVKKSSNRTVL